MAVDLIQVEPSYGLIIALHTLPAAERNICYVICRLDYLLSTRRIARSLIGIL